MHPRGEYSRDEPMEGTRAGNIIPGMARASPKGILKACVFLFLIIRIGERLQYGVCCIRIERVRELSFREVKRKKSEMKA